MCCIIMVSSLCRIPSSPNWWRTLYFMKCWSEAPMRSLNEILFSPKALQKNWSFESAASRIFSLSFEVLIEKGSSRKEKRFLISRCLPFIIFTSISSWVKLPSEWSKNDGASSFSQLLSDSTIDLHGTTCVVSKLLATHIFQLWQSVAKCSLQPSRNKFKILKIVGTWSLLIKVQTTDWFYILSLLSASDIPWKS